MSDSQATWTHGPYSAEPEYCGLHIGHDALEETDGTQAPVNLSRLRCHPDSQLILYESKAGHEVDDESHLNPLEFLARVLIHIPEPNKHLVHFYGVYANCVRSTYRNEDTAPPDEATDATPPRRAVSKRWAELFFRIYEVDPLTCTRCGAPMKILAFITETVTYCS